MTTKCLQNTQEKTQLDRVKNIKLYHKRDASISPHLSLTK